MLRKLAAVSLLSLLSAPLLAAECSVDIQGNDQMQFNTNAITVDKSCKQFTVNLSHPGNLPKNVMGHNWVLSTAADMQGVVTDGMASGLDKDYLKPDDSRVIAHTKLIGSGEKGLGDLRRLQAEGRRAVHVLLHLPGPLRADEGHPDPEVMRERSAA
ncbi:azurin [Pseudomonas aeruginosa]|nr:azurin [Pseudomonas aeruginosa]